MSSRRFTVRLVWEDTRQPVADCRFDEHYDHGVPQQVGDVLRYAPLAVPALLVMGRVWPDPYTVDLLVRPLVPPLVVAR